MKPPHITALLEDPIYRKYVRTVPILSPTLTAGYPWAVWARYRNGLTGSWRGGMFSTYREGWAVVVKAIRNPSYEDVAIVSRRQFFEPPRGFYWDRPFEWCSRCRRPTMFAIRPRHHALTKVPAITLDDPYRCYYCGVRRCAMPTYHG